MTSAADFGGMLNRGQYDDALRLMEQTVRQAVAVCGVHYDAVLGRYPLS